MGELQGHRDMQFRNNKAAFLWGFTVIFLLFVGAMTYVFVRDGAPAGYSPLFVQVLLGFFWIGGGGFFLYAASKPCFKVELEPDGHLVFVRRYPFRAERRRVARRDVMPASVVETEDDEGAPYYRGRVNLADGSIVDLTEGHDREHCEATCQRFNRLIS